MKMKIFTIENGNVMEGALVETFTLQGADVSIPAILVGEKGRGRELGVLPVQLLPSTYRNWEEDGYAKIRSAKIASTKAGKPNLIELAENTDEEKCICVFRTQIGFRGSNSHTGDRQEEYWVPLSDIPKGVPVKEKYTKEEVKKYAPVLCEYEGYSYEDARWDACFDRKLQFLPFHGDVICRGIIAQGDAGRMGSGEQLVAIMPADTVFRTGYSGRLYGQPGAHYYIYRDGQLLAATWEEREISDIF